MQSHIPVLLKEVLDNISYPRNAIFVDCTLGEGGHSFEILKNSKEGSFLFAFDQDEESIELSKKKFDNIFFNKSFEFIKTNFINIKEVLNKRKIFKVDYILYDLGFVANQMFTVERGFSYKYSQKLDMRMNKEQFLTAEKILNNYSKNELIKIFRNYGEQEYSEQIASKIIEIRKIKLIKTTDQLINIIKTVLPNQILKKKHPGRKIFQALRIAVNNEFIVLEDSLKQAIELLNEGGRILVISYHSLEDRIVKNVFNSYKNIKIITKKPILPSTLEILKNRQSRSAKLRIVEKLNEQ